jgi:hypothetical protein
MTLCNAISFLLRIQCKDAIVHGNLDNVIIKPLLLLPSAPPQPLSDAVSTPSAVEAVPEADGKLRGAL